MTKADAGKERFEQVELLGKSVLFTEQRVDRATVPEGLRCYELRHTDADWGEPCELARGIMVISYMGKPIMAAIEHLAKHPPNSTRRNAAICRFL